MRRSLGVGLGLALVATTGAGRSGRADPVPPEVTPIHLQREDAQRLRELQRTLDHDHPIPDAPAAITSRQPPPSTSTGGMHATGYVSLGVAGVAGLASIPFLTSSPGSDSDDTVGALLLVVSAVAGIVSFASLVGGRSSVSVKPTVAAGSVGLSIMGRM